MTPWPDRIVDPHIHQWDPLTTERVVSREARAFRWLPRVPRAVRRVLPQADREFAGSPHHLLKPYLPADHRRDCGRVPVGSVVHIEAEWPRSRNADAVGETRWVSALPWGTDGAADLVAMVVKADPRWPDVGDVLDQHLEASALVRGVRCSASAHPDPGVRDFCDTASLYTEPAFLSGFAALAERGLSFELWCYSHQLPDALGLVRAYPETTFVLDHYGTPVGALGPRGQGTGHTRQQRADILSRWRDDVAAVAAEPNVVAKHSGLGMPVLGHDPAHPVDEAGLGRFRDLVGPLVRHLHDTFGPERTMWASNYPIDKPGITLPASIELLTGVLGADADLPQLLGGVARRTYRL